ncbi:MAG: hypothetical protein AABZ53_11100 [Planctomycetota bacterium]
MISSNPFACRLGSGLAMRHLLVAALSLCAPVLAQPTPSPTNIPLPPSSTPAKPKQPEQAATAPAKPVEPVPPTATRPAPTTEFDGLPLAVREVGLAMLIPKSSKANVERAADASGGFANIEIVPPDSTWVMYVRSKRLTDALITTEEVMSEIVKNIESAAASAKAVPEVLAKDKTFIISGRPAYLVYILIPQAEGKPGLVRGLGVSKIQPGSFMLFEIICARTEYERARVVFEDCVATAVIEDPRAEVERTQSLVKTGIAFIASITEQDLKDVVTALPERWERTYRPGKSGGDSDSTEISYSRYRYFFGERSKFPGIPKGSKAQQLGVFVQIDSRAVDGKVVVDSQGQFFVSADRKEEFWSLATARKEGNKPQLYTETGVRDDLEMSVSRAFPDGRTDATKPQIKGEGYISVAESLILPQLLVRKNVTADFGFFTYQHEHRNIRLRRETFSPVGVTGKVFEIRTRLNDDCLWQIARYRENGEFISVENPDRSVREQTTVEKLRTLWKSKGLPLD